MDTIQETRSPLRVELVTSGTRLDVTQFTNNIQYSYSTTPPWDTVAVDLLVPMSLLDKVLPGTGVQVGERAAATARTPEPGFWVIVWLEDWPNYRSPSAMAVGHVDTIAFGERDTAGTSASSVKATTPCTLQCTGMLALVGKSNVRMTMSGEQNVAGFLYDMSSFKGAMKAHLGNLTNNEVGTMLSALWKETVKVRAPWGQAGGGRTSGLVSNAVQSSTHAESPDPTPVPTGKDPALFGAREQKTAYAELGAEIPVVYNSATTAFAPQRKGLLRPVYGKQLMHVPALWPDSSLWQWFTSMFVPSSEVVEMFATLDPAMHAEGATTTALARSLGGAQPALHYRFKPFALHAISQETIQGQTHTRAEQVSQATPMSEQLGLFQGPLSTETPSPQMYYLLPSDIFSHQVSWSDDERVNLVFARPAVVSGTGSVRPFSQAGNVVIPDNTQFANHGLRAFEVDWPYLAVQDLRETVQSRIGVSGKPLGQDATELEDTVRKLLESFEAAWNAAYGPLSEASSQASFPEEPSVYRGQKSVAQVEAAWKAWTTALRTGVTYSLNDKLAEVKEAGASLAQLNSISPRYACATWTSYEAAALLRGQVLENLAKRKRQLTLAISKDAVSALNEFGKAFALGVGSDQANAPTRRMLTLLVEALEQDAELLRVVITAYPGLKQPKGTVPATAAAAVATGVSTPGAFKADHTLTNEFSALNELLWSIKGESERFASMTLVIRGRPLLRQGYFIEGDLGPRPGRDTVFRYFSGYIEHVHHEFRVDPNATWVSRTTLRLSRVWFRDSFNAPTFYTPVAAASLGNQTQSEQPNKVLRGKSIYATNDPGSSGKPTLWDLTGWDALRDTYTMDKSPATADRLTDDNYRVRGVVFHHTAISSTRPHHTLAAWRAKAGKQGYETASHFEITPDGNIFMYYDPATDVLDHAKTSQLYTDKGTLRFFKNITVGIDLTGDMRITAPTPVQYLSARLLVRYLANKFDFVPVVKPLPARVTDAHMSSWKVDNVSTLAVLKDKFTVFGHASTWPTKCPGWRTDLGQMVDPVGAVFDVFDASPDSLFDVHKVTNANAKDYRSRLNGLFSDVVIP